MAMKLSSKNIQRRKQLSRKRINNKRLVKRANKSNLKRVKHRIQKGGENKFSGLGDDNEVIKIMKDRQLKQLETNTSTNDPGYDPDPNPNPNPKPKNKTRKRRMEKLFSSFSRKNKTKKQNSK